MNAALNLRHRHPLLATIGCSLLFAVMLMGRPHFAAATAGACAQPATDYGNASGLSVNVGTGATATYRIWTRMVAPDTTNNTYLLEVDGSNCYTVGGTGVQTYTSAQATASTYFSTSTSNTTDWIHTQSSGASLDISLTSGTHTFRMIGNAPNVVVDRLIVTQDLACIPQGVGDNCATPPDNTPPVVGITSPVSGTSVNSPVSVAVNATDDSGVVSKVELYVDGSSTAYGTDASSPYNFSVTGLAPGAHTLLAKAYDPSNNSSSSSLTSFTVADTTAPTSVAITSPTAGQTVSGSISLSATAADNVGITKFIFTVDTGTPITVNSGSPGSTPLTTTTLSNGTHTVKVTAYDAANNNTTSSTVSFTVNNPTGGGGDTTAPTVGLTTPVNGAILNTDSATKPYDSKAYVMSAAASDTSGIKQVVFQVDGVTRATDTTAPYNMTFDLSTLSCGSHTVSAIATDNSTNQNTATATATVQVTLAADLNSTPDCKVGLPDFSIFGTNYNKTGAAAGRSDINGDGIVNLPDWAIFGASYNKQLQ